MNIQEFKDIFTKYGGCVTPDQIEQLAEFAPDLTLGVKMGYGPRFTTTAKNFKFFITTAKNFKLDLENNTKFHLDIHNVDQYVRDVYVYSAYDEVRQIFGWRDSY